MIRLALAFSILTAAGLQLVGLIGSTL